MTCMMCGENEGVCTSGCNHPVCADCHVECAVCKHLFCPDAVIECECGDPRCQRFMCADCCPDDNINPSCSDDPSEAMSQLTVLPEAVLVRQYA
jgi:hypothetical protein